MTIYIVKFTIVTKVNGGIMKEKPILKNRLKKIRRDKKLSQRQLAEIAGTSRTTISALENGVFNPTASLALILCCVLDKKFEELFYFEPEELDSFLEPIQ